MIKAVLFALLLLAVGAPAYAIGIDLSKIPKVKVYEYMPPAQFEAVTKEVAERNPYDDALLSYKIRLPKKWTDNVQKTQKGFSKESGVLNANVLDIIARYIGAPKNLVRSHITVEAQVMTYEISAQNWFVNFILSNGFSLTSLTEKSPREVEAMYVAVEKDQAYAVRARIIINGPRLIMVRYYLPQENYEEEKVEQAQIVDSFALGNYSKERIEKQEEYGFLDQSYFNYPESWILREKSILSIERMSAMLYQESKDEEKSVLEGHIKISVVSRLLKTTLAQEINAFKGALKIPHYTIGPLIETVKYKYDPSVKSGQAQIYELVPDDKVRLKSYELLVSISQGDDYYYITSLITASREQNFYSWARNMEAARIVNETMRRGNTVKVDPNDPYFDYLKQ